MNENYNDKVISNLQKILDTKDLSDFLKEQFLGVLSILSDKNTTEEKKHFTRILAEQLISNARELPDIKARNKSK